jgi:hypothetical protein
MFTMTESTRTRTSLSKTMEKVNGLASSVKPETRETLLPARYVKHLELWSIQLNFDK